MTVAAKRRFPGWRSLRRGDEGDDVLWLQERLASFGYEVGEIDGRFGYLTEDALLEFQRDHSLRVDGIAGPEVLAALTGEAPRRRIVHELRQGERLSDLAQAYGTSVDAIRWMNRLNGASRLFPGRQLVLRSSHVMIGLPHGADRSIQRTLASYRRSVSSVAAFSLTIEADGSLSGQLDETVRALAQEENWPLIVSLVHQRDGEPGAGDLVGALSHRKRRRRLLESLKHRFEEREFQGLLLELGPDPFGRGGSLVPGIVALKKEMPQLPLAVAAGPPPRGWRDLLSDPDYRKVGQCADRFLLSLHRWECLLGPKGETPHRELIEAWIGRTVRLIPPWKVLLGVPMGACKVATATPLEVGYRAAVAAALAQRRRLKPDQHGFLSHSVPEEEGEATYVAVGREAFSRLISLAYRRRLAGVYLHPVGLEDRRLWELVSRRLWVERSRSWKESWV